MTETYTYTGGVLRPGYLAGGRAGAPATGPGKWRDSRIDLIRGLALATIFINHVPGNPFEHYTSRNFGFSDAAEAFVLLAGVSAALAYARPMQGPNLWSGTAKIWSRAWTLYLVHILISLAVIAVVTGLLRFYGVPDMMAKDGFRLLVEDPVGVLIGLPLMLHQFGYVNILPLYVLLLLATPGLLLLAQRSPALLLTGSVLLWGFAGLSFTNLPNWPSKGGWFLNPMSWQLIYVIGLMIGLRLKDKERLVPAHPVLIALALIVVIGALVWLRVPGMAGLGNAVMVKLSQLGLPPLLTNFNKGYVQAPRLMHLLALAYLVSLISFLPRLSASRWVWPLVVMGRQALPVFALGTVLSFVARAVKAVAAPEQVFASPLEIFLLDVTLIGGGLLALIGFAAVFDAAKTAARSEKAAPRQA